MQLTLCNWHSCSPADCICVTSAPTGTTLRNLAELLLRMSLTARLDMQVCLLPTVTVHPFAAATVTTLVSPADAAQLQAIAADLGIELEVRFLFYRLWSEFCIQRMVLTAASACALFDDRAAGQWRSYTH